VITDYLKEKPCVAYISMVHQKDTIDLSQVMTTEVKPETSLIEVNSKI
jgi:hypothetical protein